MKAKINKGLCYALAFILIISILFMAPLQLVEASYLKEEKANPFFTIESVEDLVNLQNRVNSGESFGGKLIEILNDIDLTEYLNKPENIATGWIPVGNESFPFAGSIEGNGHTISGLSIVSNNRYVALIGYADAEGPDNAYIKNLNIEVGSKGIKQNRSGLGEITVSALVGYANKYNFENCHASNGFIDAALGSIGGVVGGCDSTNLYNCSSDVELKNKDGIAGGLIGFLDTESEVRDCWSTAKITSSFAVGGLIGEVSDSKVVSSFSSGGRLTLTEDERYIGGLIGQGFDASIEDCFYDGDVVGTRYTGGLIGYIGGKSVIRNCFVKGNIQSDKYAGGIAAIFDSEKSFDKDYIKGLIENCYFVGDIFTSDNQTLINRHGGLVGYLLYADMYNCYYDQEVNADLDGVGNISGHFNIDCEYTGINSTEIRSSKFVNLLNGYKNAFTLRPSKSVCGCENTYIPEIKSMFQSDIEVISEASKSVATVAPIAIPKDESSIIEGKGTDEVPYIIKDAKQLSHMRSHYSNGDSFALDNDIDLSEYLDEYHHENGWEPIGNNEVYGEFDKVFYGNLNGNNHVISGLWSIQKDKNVGLFGELGSIKGVDKISEISNLRIESSDKGVSQQNSSADKTKIGAIGILAGKSYRAKIENVAVKGSVSNDAYYTGGMIGDAFQTSFSGVSSDVLITSVGNYIGGLSGNLYSSDVSESYSKVTINTKDTYVDIVGGLFGKSYGTDIDKTFAIVDISTKGKRVGGLAGYPHGKITNSYSVGRIAGKEYIGGFSGENASETRNSYTNVKVEVVDGDYQSDNVGSFYGSIMMARKTFNSYANADVNIGLRITDNSSGITDLPKEKKTEEMLASSFAQMLNTEEKVFESSSDGCSCASFYPELVIFANSEDLNKRQISKESVSEDIKVTPENEKIYTSGDGTKDNPFEISSVEQLAHINSHLSNGKHFKLVKDIDLKEYIQEYYSTHGWEPLGNEKTPFKGSFDGDGYTISNLRIDNNTESECVNTGLFGVVKDSVVCNVNVELEEISDINTSSNFVGALVGTAENSDIYNCSSSGEIVSSGVAGGLVGKLTDSDISDCYSMANITGELTAGGLVGVAENVSMEHSYVSGNIRAIKSAGGLIGEHSTEIGVGSSEIKENIILANVFSESKVSYLISTYNKELSDIIFSDNLVYEFSLLNEVPYINSDRSIENDNLVGVSATDIWRKEIWERYGFDFQSKWYWDEVKKAPAIVKSTPIVYPYSFGFDANVKFDLNEKEEHVIELTAHDEITNARYAISDSIKPVLAFDKVYEQKITLNGNSSVRYIHLYGEIGSKIVKNTFGPYMIKSTNLSGGGGVGTEIEEEPEEISKEAPYINGYSDGTFKPNALLTRSEAVQLLYNIHGEEILKNVDESESFIDVNPDAWNYKAIKWASENKIISGYSDNTFRPNQNITRAEFSQIMCNTLDMLTVKNRVTKEALSDVNGHWAAESIAILFDKSVISGYPDNTFKPNKPLSRAESVTMISRLEKRTQDYKAEKVFSDVDSNHWAYQYIMNAANGR